MKIALIAHDKKKDAMITLAIKYRDVLAPHELYATGTTGTLVMGETGLKITRMKSGPLGGDQQIGSMIAENTGTIRVLSSEARWHGVTYKDDLPSVVAAIQAMKDAGKYPEYLWR